MNLMIILGFAMIIAVILVIIAINIKYNLNRKQVPKSLRKKMMIALIVFSFTGIIIAQLGDNSRKITYTPIELELLTSGKTFSELTKEEDTLRKSMLTKYLFGDAKENAKYDEIFLQWAVDNYKQDNSHRKDLTDEIIRELILKDWALKRKQ